jgi:long-chain acyl-CoA synthetase
MNLANWLTATARRWPDAPAIFAGETLHATYGAFAARAAAMAGALQTRFGLRAGDRVAMFLHNGPEYLELLNAIWWFGGIAVPVNAKLHPEEVGWIVENSGARLLISDAPHSMATGCACVTLDDLAEFWQGAPAPGPVDLPPGALAWLFYTSGTTGRPKGVMLSHDNLCAMAQSYALDVDRPAADQTSLYAAPMSHGAGLYNLIFTRLGARHVIPASGGFDPAEIETLAARFGNLVMFAAPTMIKRMVDHARHSGFDGQGIRTIIYGGGPMYAQGLAEARAQFGDRFAQIYGQGESPMTITALHRDMLADHTQPNAAARHASVGIAMSGVELRITGADGTSLPPGQPGEITLRGATVMRGYWDAPEATAAALREGWLHTGDIGVLDADGFLTLTDRSKDLIISGGSNVYPREVEEVLAHHPALSEVAVVGVPDPEWGEAVVACAVLRAGAEVAADDLRAYCRAHIAAFKIPKRVVFYDSLPKNNYGKVLKTELRARLAGRVG